MITYILLLSISSILIPPNRAEDACRMMLDKHNRAEMMSRNFVFGNNNLWPNKQVPYVFRPGFTSQERTLIREAMDKIEAKSCVRFVPRRGQKNYVQLRNDMRGCFSTAIGFNRNRNIIDVNLERRGCMGQSTIIHELFHTLGFLHEQSRPDRDRFIQVNWNNIIPSIDYFYQFARPRASGENIPRCNFQKLSPYNNCYNGMTATTLGLPYDYKSVMQYSRTAFSKNGGDTMTPILGKGSLGNRVGMTSLDIQKLNKAYQCRSGTCCKDRYRFCSSFRVFCMWTSWMRRDCKKTCNSC